MGFYDVISVLDSIMLFALGLVLAFFILAPLASLVLDIRTASSKYAAKFSELKGDGKGEGK